MVKLTIIKGMVEASFKYDTKLVDIMRKQPKRIWDMDKKVWTVPVENINILLADLINYEVTIVEETWRETVETIMTANTTKTYVKKEEEKVGENEIIIFGNEEEIRIMVGGQESTRLSNKLNRVAKRLDSGAWKVIYGKTLENVLEILNTVKGIEEYTIKNEFEEPTDPTEPTEKKEENKKEENKKEEVKIEGVEFKTQPFQHQVEGVEFGMKNDRFILADEQGLGKTKQAIDIACNKKATRGFRHCLIICGVNGLKYNWEKEVAVHSNEKSIILGGKKGTNAAKLKDLETISEDTYFLITNIESMRNKEVVEKLVEMCTNEIIGMIIVDEMHKCKNAASQQAKGLLKLEAATKIAMTGTPLMNTPLDVYPMLKWTGLEKHSFFQFKKRYAIMGGFGGYQVMGYKNLNEIQEKLDKKMLRRLKKDVLDLPEKVRTTEYVELGKEQAKIYKEVLFDIRRNVDKIKAAANPLSQLIRLRQATASAELLSSTITESAKLQRLAELVEDAEGNGQKVIVFSNWTQMTKLAEKVLKQHNPVVITGETKESERVQNQDTFTNNPDCKVIIGTIGAMGTGLTLTAASTVIFLDSPWTRAEKEQAEDRAHRIGTTGTVNIISIVCKDTIDERIEEIIEGKGKMADALIDGEIKFNKNDTVDFLLS